LALPHYQAKSIEQIEHPCSVILRQAAAAAARGEKRVSNYFVYLHLTCGKLPDLACPSAGKAFRGFCLNRVKVRCWHYAPGYVAALGHELKALFPVEGELIEIAI
jgi:hypothetical protein